VPPLVTGTGTGSGARSGLSSLGRVRSGWDGAGAVPAFPVFAEAFDAVCAGLDAHLTGSVAAVVRGEGDGSCPWWPGR